MKQLIKSEREFLLKENSKYRKQIELQNRQIEDLMSLCLWSARRLQKPNTYYVEEQLEKNRKLEVAE